MTDEEKKMVVFLRIRKMGYKAIATEMGLSSNSVKSYLLRLSPEEMKPHCFYCGKAIPFEGKTKVPKFCSAVCKSRWWNTHPEQRHCGKEHICKTCGKRFYSQRENSKYCSRSCYYTSRKVVANNDD